MTLGVTPRQPDLLGSTADYCDGRVAADSIYGLLHRECARLFEERWQQAGIDGAGYSPHSAALCAPV